MKKPRSFKVEAFRQMSGAMFSQGALSASNFILNILVARLASKGDYAKFSIILAIIYTAEIYQSALITTPFMVLAGKKDDKDRLAFANGLYSIQLRVFLVVFGVVLLGALAFCGWRFNANFITIIGSTTAIFLYLMRQFQRDLLYSRLQVKCVMTMDLSYVVALLASLWIIYYFSNVNNNNVLCALNLSFLAANLAGYGFNRGEIVDRKMALGGALRESWTLGKWGIISAIGSQIQCRIYIVVVSIYLGLESMANISAGRALLLPINFLIASSGKIILAKGVRTLTEHGTRTLIKFIFGTTAMLGMAWAVYCLPILIMQDQLVEFAYKGKYENLHGIILSWGIFYLIFALKYPVFRLLLVRREFKYLAKCDVVTAIVSSLSCWIMVKQWAEIGAISSIILGELVLCLGIVVYWFRRRRASRYPGSVDKPKSGATENT